MRVYVGSLGSLVSFECIPERVGTRAIKFAAVLCQTRGESCLDFKSILYRDYRPLDPLQAREWSTNIITKLLNDRCLLIAIVLLRL